MKKYAELSISIRKGLTQGSAEAGAAFTYFVEMRYIGADSDVETLLLDRGQLKFADLSNLVGYVSDPAQYGKALSAAVFHGDIAAKFKQARDGARDKGAKLRVRVYIEPQASELQGVHWEAMADPDPDKPIDLFASESIWWSRYLASGDFQEMRTREHPEKLKVLVVVSNPSNLTTHNPPLAAIPPGPAVELVTNAVAEAFENRLVCETLGNGERATDKNIISKLREGVDVLYLMCHGFASPGAPPILFLEKPDGTIDKVQGEVLVQRIQDLEQRPRLIVLASCQSAGAETGISQEVDKQGQAFAAAIGPRLAAAGIPAVLAMSGNFSTEAAKAFIPAFFKELVSEAGAGQIDRALSMARFQIKDPAQAWRPVLFMRLRSGRIWYIAGFNKEDGKKLPWDAICTAVTHGEFLPIVGPDLPALVEGTQRDLATALANRFGFPLAPWEKADLRKVSQFILTDKQPDDLRSAVRDEQLGLVRLKNPEFASVRAVDVLPRIMEAKLKDPEHPYSILTELKAKLYLTTTPDMLLELALTQQRGQQPPVLLCSWRDERQSMQDFSATGGDAVPTPEAPALFYVFGKRAEGPTWVLTEDDVVDYLIRASRRNVWPGEVAGAIPQSALFFIGFPVDHWNLRVLLRIILQMECSAFLVGKPHICVQVNPEETTLADALRAKRYFEKCLRSPAEVYQAAKLPTGETGMAQQQHSIDLDIYWGSAKEFLRDLKKQLATYTETEHATC